MKIYILIKASGSYDDYSEEIIEAYTEESEATYKRDFLNKEVEEFNFIYNKCLEFSRQLYKENLAPDYVSAPSEYDTASSGTNMKRIKNENYEDDLVKYNTYLKLKEDYHNKMHNLKLDFFNNLPESEKIYYKTTASKYKLCRNSVLGLDEYDVKYSVVETELYK